MKPNFHAIFEAVPGLYLILKPDLSIVDASDAYLKATRTSREAIIDKLWYDVFPENPEEKRAKGVKTINDSLRTVITTKRTDSMGVIRYDLPLNANGKQKFETHYWSVVNSPCLSADGQLSFVINSVLDVTDIIDLKHKQVRLSRQSKQLERQNKLFQAQVSQTMKEIREHKKNESELRRLNRLKSEFMAAVSHHLRTPLTSIKWTSETLLEPTQHLNKSRQQHYLAQIHSSNERMIELVRELLDVSKIDFGPLASKPEAVELPNVLNQVLDDAALQISMKKITVTKDIERKMPSIFIDRAWLLVIFQNLLTNSIKYSAPGGDVVVRIYSEAGKAIIAVSDRGCGIPLKQQSKIFNKFFRADNAQDIINEGSGLGLYITKAIIEQAGGKIWFESVENRGSTFYVTLPYIKKTANKEE